MRTRSARRPDLAYGTKSDIRFIHRLQPAATLYEKNPVVSHKVRVTHILINSQNTAAWNVEIKIGAAAQVIQTGRIDVTTRRSERLKLVP